jgi:DNA-binding CsgD family transcriptional regulator
LALPMEGRDEALALAEEDVALAEASGLPRPYGVSLRALGLLSRGRAGLEHLSESVRQLEQTSARLELARSLVAQGAALRRDGRRVESRTPLARGRDLAHQCGATRLVASAGQDLLAAGARPRRISRTGLPALTPSELRVAQLAGAGRSNRQIAQELFISIKTVETHLTRVYAKLNLTAADRRTRLSTAVESGLP